MEEKKKSDPVVTYVLKTEKPTDCSMEVYAVVEMGMRRAQFIMDKYEECPSITSTDLEEVVYGSDMVMWADKVELSSRVRGAVDIFTGEPLTRAVNRYRRGAILGEIPVPLAPSLEHETLHLEETGIYWKVGIDGLKGKISTPRIFEFEIQAISEGNLEDIIDREFIPSSEGKFNAGSYIKDFVGWSVDPSDDYHGEFLIHDVGQFTSSRSCDKNTVYKVDQTVASLLESAPKLFVVCQEMLDWIGNAPEQYINSIEQVLKRKCPEYKMRDVIQKIKDYNKKQEVR